MQMQMEKEMDMDIDNKTVPIGGALSHHAMSCENLRMEIGSKDGWPRFEESPLECVFVYVCQVKSSCLLLSCSKLGTKSRRSWMG